MSLYGAMGAALKSTGELKVKTESLSEIGGSLRDARISFSLSIDEVANELMISPSQIEALEQGDWSKLPAEVYARGYLRRYADFLGFNSSELLQKLNPAKPKLELVQTPIISKQNIDNEVRILVILIAFAFISLLVALFYNVKSEDNSVNMVRPLPNNLLSYMQGHTSETLRVIPDCLQQRLVEQDLWQCYLPLRFEQPQQYSNEIALNYIQ
jgi:transcriptional regulator with XRE-family HTH domain